MDNWLLMLRIVFSERWSQPSALSSPHPTYRPRMVDSALSFEVTLKKFADSVSFAWRRVGHEYKAFYGVWVISSLFKTFLPRVICSISDCCRRWDERWRTDWIYIGWTIILHVHAPYKREERRRPGASQGTDRPRQIGHWTVSLTSINLYHIEDPSSPMDG